MLQLSLHTSEILYRAGQEALGMGAETIEPLHVLCALVDALDPGTRLGVERAGVQLQNLVDTARQLARAGSASARRASIAERSKTVEGVLTLARDIAAQTPGEPVNLEHLLLALVRTLRSLGRDGVQSLGISISNSATELVELADYAWLAITSYSRLPLSSEGLSQEAMSVVGRAVCEAKKMRHNKALPEHLLLGLLGERTAPVSVGMAEAGLTRDRLVSALLQQMPGTRAWPGVSSFETDASFYSVLEVAREKAQIQMSPKITTVSILTALLDSPSPGVAELLNRLQIDSAEIRKKVMDRVASSEEVQ